MRSWKKAKIVLTKYCEEHCRDRASYDLGLHPINPCFAQD